MADPFSIIALLDTAFGLGYNIYAFFSALADAPEEIRDYLTELQQLNAIFKDVRKYLNDFSTSAFAGEDGLSMALVHVTVEQCESEFKDIYGAVQKLDSAQGLNFFRTLAHKSAWVFSRDEIEKSTKRFERSRQALLISLSISGRQNDISIREQVKYVRTDIGGVKDAIQAQKQEILLTLHAMFVGGQEKVQDLAQRAQEQKIESQIRLNDLSNSLAADFATLPNPFAAEVDNQTQAANVSEAAASDSRREKMAQPQTVKASGERPVVYRQQNVLAIAFERFRSQLPPSALRDFEKFQSISTMSDVQRLLEKEFMQRQLSLVPRPLVSFMERMQRFTEQMRSIGDYAVQYDPVYRWSATRLLIQTMSKDQAHFGNIAEALSDVNETIRSCEREFELYPGDEIQELMVKLYTGLFGFLQKSLDIISQSDIKRGLSRLSSGAQVQFQDSISEIRKISNSVTKEVEYRHRVELREANSRLKDMEKDQQRMLAAVEDQRRILASLQEERKIMTVIQEQQKILQVVQQLQMRFAAFAPATMSAVKVESAVHSQIAAKEGEVSLLE